MKALEIRENMINAKDEYSEKEYADSLQHINENMLVKKCTGYLTVKNFPN